MPQAGYRIVTGKYRGWSPQAHISPVQECQVTSSPGNWRIPSLPRPGRTSTIPIPPGLPQRFSLSSCFLLPVFACLFDPQITFQLTLYFSCWTFCVLSLCCVFSVVGLFTFQRCFCGDVFAPSIIITATESETTRACNVAGVASSLIHPRQRETTPPRVPSSRRISLSVNLKSYSRLFIHHGAISTQEK